MENKLTYKEAIEMLEGLKKSWSEGMDSWINQEELIEAKTKRFAKDKNKEEKF